MKNIGGKTIEICILGLIFHLCFPIQAHAYIDPGTGSLILQALAAGAFAVLAFWRSLREKIMSFFKSNKKDED